MEAWGLLLTINTIGKRLVLMTRPFFPSRARQGAWHAPLEALLPDCRQASQPNNAEDSAKKRDCIYLLLMKRLCEISYHAVGEFKMCSFG